MLWSYELYFDEKLNSALLSLLNSFQSHPINHMSWIELLFNEDKKIELNIIMEKNLNIINDAYKKLNKPEILNEIKKIYQNKWIKQIEG